MRSFYTTYEIVQRAVGQLDSPPSFCLTIPWGHNISLMEKVKTIQEREWYAKAALENGWSRPVLELWIESNLYHRKGKASNNFQRTLPSPQSDLAEQILHDPYNFDFLTMVDEAREKEIENGLMLHIQKFLLELGQGFSFVGRQVPLRVGDEDFYVDLLFYHIKLKCYFVIELKAVPFKPEFTGQMDFYLAVINDIMRNPGDNPAIGLILCKNKNSVTVKYALDGILSPIGVASYETALVESLPANIKTSLPTIEEIEAEAALYTNQKLAAKKSTQMQYNDYIAEIEYDDTTKLFRGKIIGIEIVFYGKSIEELEEAFKTAIEAELFSHCT